MYQRLLVAVDNSTSSNLATRRSLELGRALGATLTGCHVYAAGLHDQRFRQMEPGLPERYQQPEEMARQRDTHDSLITRGLELISDSYLDAFQAEAETQGVPFSRRVMEGKNYLEILRATQEEPSYDLVLLGALGLGAVRRSLLGSVCERVVRRAQSDVWVVRGEFPLAGGIAVAVDGSPWALAGVKAAASLARTCGAPVTALAAFDPYFHQAAFKSIAGVLSEEAGRLFRFKEQERLHEEIIDKGLEQLYQRHLEAARRLAQAEGVALEMVLLKGKPFDSILDFLDERRPSLLVVGRLGTHWVEGLDLGSTAENLVRLAPCDVLVVARPLPGVGGYSQLESAVARDPEAPPVAWTEEARARLAGVPSGVREMVARRLEAVAREEGLGTITPEFIDKVKKRWT